MSNTNLFNSRKNIHSFKGFLNLITKFNLLNRSVFPHFKLNKELMFKTHLNRSKFNNHKKSLNTLVRIKYTHLRDLIEMFFNNLRRKQIQFNNLESKPNNLEDLLNNPINKKIRMHHLTTMLNYLSNPTNRSIPHRHSQ
jgi:hypothetical protein